MAFTHYRTKGVFVGKENKGEADQLFTVFTQDFGKIQVLGKSIRKITSKLRSGADLFFFSELEFIQGRGYKTLTDSMLIKKLRPDSRITQVFSLVPEHERDDRIWKLLFSAFTESNLAYYWFFWNTVSLLGYAPEIYHCVICRKKLLPETFSFSAEQGGVVCWRCEGQGMEISVDTVKLIRLFLKHDINMLNRFKIDSLDNLEDITQYYLDSFQNHEIRVQ